MKLQRLFIVSELPKKLKKLREKILIYGYFKDSKRRNIRLKQRGSRFFRSIDNFPEKEIDYALYKKEWKKTRNKRLTIERRILKETDIIYELDQIKKGHNSLLTCRVLFNSKKEYKNFKPPSYLGSEVSYDFRYDIEYLAGKRPSYIKSLRQDNYTHIGTLPYRFKKDRLELLLITTRSNGKEQWIFPKGKREKKKNDAKIALLEAKEEAGIKGKITASAFRISFKKGFLIQTMQVYPIQIHKLNDTWLEKKDRKRKMVSLNKAEKMIKQKGLKDSLKYLKNLL